ncbi:MAG TPA: hypothetical protein VMK16_16910 [Acidimicrobiales bacterium]|nr:hypothetical protein [Acidimicrobiales bacterium]
MADADAAPERLTDSELWAAVETTLHDLLLPAIRADAEWARAAAVQLVGLARYARNRPSDQTEQRITELASALDDLRDNEIVASVWAGERTDRAVRESVGRALSMAVGRADAAADEIRRALRSIVVRQLDDELAITGPLVAAFRGQIDG